MPTQPYTEPEIIAALFTGDDHLSYGAIDTKPIDYRFAEQKYDHDEEDEGWRVAYHPNIDEQLGGLDEIEDEAGITIEVPDCDGEIRVTIEEPGPLAQAWLEKHGFAVNEDEFEVHQAHPAWKSLVRLFGLDPVAFEEDTDERMDEWGPVMNYAYPLPQGVLTRADWHRCMNNCTVVYIDGAAYLALTGGGMDLTWEICETYLRCGYWPPAHFCNLPEMAGRGESARDKAIIAACKVSLKATIERAKWRLENLEKMERGE